MFGFPPSTFRLALGRSSRAKAALKPPDRRHHRVRRRSATVRRATRRFVARGEKLRLPRRDRRFRPGTPSFPTSDRARVAWSKLRLPSFANLEQRPDDRLFVCARYWNSRPTGFGTWPEMVQDEIGRGNARVGLRLFPGRAHGLAETKTRCRKKVTPLKPAAFKRRISLSSCRRSR